MYTFAREGGDLAKVSGTAVWSWNRGARVRYICRWDLAFVLDADTLILSLEARARKH